ncbi:MAG: hypothetical protein Q4D77_06490 [Peptostreptococcaceae bacterium]|nr:hypothetical protein [Peptostreptococcaceae bacterium]
MIKYYLINKKILVKGETFNEANALGLVQKVFAFRDGVWQEINPNGINDRIMGFDPFEDSVYGIGNMDIMDELQQITEKEADRFIESYHDHKP